MTFYECSHSSDFLSVLFFFTHYSPPSLFLCVTLGFLSAHTLSAQPWTAGVKRWQMWWRLISQQCTYTFSLCTGSPLVSASLPRESEWGEEVLAVSACDVIKKAEQLRRGGEENVSSSFSIFKPCTIVINSYTELSLWWSIACFAKVLKGSTFSELLRFTNLQKFKATRNVKALSVQQCTRAGDRFCAGMLV